MSQSSPSLSSQVPLNPTFRRAAVNTVAVIPLLSHHPDTGALLEDTHSLRSHAHLMDALRRHHTSATIGNSTINNTFEADNNSSSSSSDEFLLVVPNSSLTRPGDWRYNETPLKAFHWQHGCQRLLVHDGRPEYSRYAYDGLNESKKDWLDLLPHRRTAAVVGVLNMRDCHSLADLHRAEEALHQWAVRYASSPYSEKATTADLKKTKGGSSSKSKKPQVLFERDHPIQRLFVYDSFDEESQKRVDLNQSRMSILAFPPADEAHVQMMDLHMNIVISDLTVAIFQSLEDKIRDSAEVTAKESTVLQQQQQQPHQPQSQPQAQLSVQASNAARVATSVTAATAGVARSTISRYMSSGSADNDEPTTSGPQHKTSRNLGIGQLAGLVNPDSKLAKESSMDTSVATTTTIPASSSAQSSSISSGGSATRDYGAEASVPSSTSSPTRVSHYIKLPKLPLLLTPLDPSSDVLRDLPAKDAEAVRRRDVGRREKFLGDLCLLAGSPLDAYERYLKAAEICSSKGVAGGGIVDPLWHASALEGCAAAHIAMAEAGGYSVDEYLENNFQMPEEIMLKAREEVNRRPSAGAHKQTLPEVAFALCEEALNILCRHEALGHLYAELLLKLADYSANEAEAHLRCRWGEGAGCYAGEVTDGPPRWERTVVSKLTFEPLKSKEGDMLAINTHNRLRRVGELLNMAAAVGSLDPSTRVDVAVLCARMCLEGIKPTHWGDGPRKPRLSMPRKAAYFTSLAAATASSAKRDVNEKTARELWLLATQLYSRTANGIDGIGGYGWATLRAFCLDCLSMQGNCRLSLQACGQLLSLLGDLDPDIPLVDDGSGRANVKREEGKKSMDDKGREESGETGVEGSLGPKSMGRPPPSLEETKEIQDAISTASQFARNLRSSYTTYTSASTFITNEAKWANINEPIPSIRIPLAESMISLNSVWPRMDYETASTAQKRCLARTAALQRAIATSSDSNVDVASAYGFDSEILPMYISSAMTIHAEPSLELECIQKRDDSDNQHDAMATFFNPYANKKSDDITAKVAEDEERAMLIKFGNRLALPIEVQRSQLEFVNDGGGRVKAAALSFIVPPRSTDFTVHFPFTVLSQSSSDGDGTVNGDIFEVKGLDLTCFGRSFFLPINALNQAEQPLTRNLPDPAAIYRHKSAAKVKDEELHANPKIQVFPCQPKLHVSLAETGAPAETITLSLSAGEVLDLPTFCLDNYLGPSSKGKIEFLEILSTLPGASNRKLFNSIAERPAEVSESEFVRELIYSTNNPVPLKIRALQCDLELDRVNGINVNSDSNRITFQIAAAHNLSEKLPDGTSFQLSFRYRGVCHSNTEVWRKREVTVQIIHTKGPRISSIAFRPDLAADSAFAYLGPRQWPRKIGEKANNKTHEDAMDITAKSTFVIDRVGVDSDVSVCDNDCYFILTVSNDTRSVLTVSRPDGPVGGFKSCPLAEMVVRPGVSAKIPVIMPRIARVDETGKPVDVIVEFISQTSLVWLCHKGGTVKARGHIRIPPSCLKDVINRQPSFLSQICVPPCSMNLIVGEKVSPKCHVAVALGKPVDVKLDVSLASWVQQQSLQDCSLIMEFRCARKDRVDTSGRREHVWAGKVSRSADLGVLGDASCSHHAKLAFCSPGQFVVSACARISRKSSTDIGDQAGEMWWAPFAQTIVVLE